MVGTCNLPYDSVRNGLSTTCETFRDQYTAVQLPHHWRKLNQTSPIRGQAAIDPKYIVSMAPNHPSLDHDLVLLPLTPAKFLILTCTTCEAKHADTLCSVPGDHSPSSLSSDGLRRHKFLVRWPA